MSNEWLWLAAAFAIGVLWLLERIREDAKEMRRVMSHQEAALIEACKEIVSISRMMEKEIHDQTDRRLRDEIRE